MKKHRTDWQAVAKFQNKNIEILPTKAINAYMTLKQKEWEDKNYMLHKFVGGKI